MRTPSVYRLCAGTLLLASVFAVPATAADVTPQRLLDADSEPHNRLMTLGNYSAHNFSRLDQINRDNVADLKAAFTMPIPTALVGTPNAGLENPPLVNDGMMFVNDAWGTIYKVDVSGGNARILWVTDPAVDKEGGHFVVTRGLALLGNMVYANLVDGRVVAVDAETGEIAWDEKLGGREEGWDFDAAEGFTAAPLAVDDMILAGQSKGDWGTRGWIAAVDAATGQERWRSYTIPGPGEPGHETWKDEHNAWRTGGGSLWTTGSYDPEQRVTIWGTANPVPMFDPEYRPGDNLFTNSAIAWSVDDGTMKWYFQYTPNEFWDFDENGVHFLYDVEIDGQSRQVVGHFARNGFFYALDRTNGQFIDGTNYVNEVNWTAGLDPKTGKPVEYDPSLDVQTYIPETRNSRARPEINMCPTYRSIRWQPPSYNPDRHVVFAAGGDGCPGTNITVEVKEPVGPEGGNPAGVNQAFLGGSAGHLQIDGYIWALDATTTEMITRAKFPYQNKSGVFATAGGLVFTGHLDGRVAAYNDETLEELWSFPTGISFKAPPMSYAIDGKQYIAIIAGGEPSPDNYTELDTMREGAMLFVFSL